MTNFVEVLKLCETAADSKKKVDKPKLAIRTALAKADGTAIRLLQEVMDPYRVFGVRKFDQPTKFANQDPSDIGFVFDTLNKLCDRELTGNAARAAVTEMLSKFTKETANYIERIIDKDPKAGFSAETVNKVLIAREAVGSLLGDTLDMSLKAVDKMLKVEGFRQFHHYDCYPDLIPSFEVQLADKCEDEEDFDNLVFPCQGDVKYDGERNVALVTDEVHYFSRSGKEAFHLPESIALELLKIRKHLGYDFILDGERFGKDFTETMNAKKAGNTVAKEGLHFRAFFLMPLEDWKNQKTSITMKEAREFLNNLLSELDCKKIILSEGKIIHNIEEMKVYCNYVIDVLKMEGLILKQLDDVYRWERNTAWMKIKRFYDVDLRVTGFYMGRPKSRLEYTVGGLILEGIDEKGKNIKTNCGSGFSDDLRDEILTNPEKFIGQTAVITYQEISQSSDLKGTDIYCLRFPTLNRFRDDKTVERIGE